MNIAEVIDRGESETTEFKTSLAEWRDVVKTISAFSNRDGGTIFIGVGDDCKILGTDNGKSTIDFDDRIEIISPGLFPESVTPEKPKHVPVNPLLCQLVYDIGLIEKYGSGIYMINELCEEWGIPKPEYDLSEVDTTVIFKSSGKSIVISEIEKMGMGLNERQVIALQYSLDKGFITNRVYREINDVSHKTAHLDLGDLIQKGLLISTGKGRSTRYVPKT